MKLNSILGAFAAAFVSIWLSGCASSLTSASTSGAAHPSGKAVKKVDFLFVQTAKGFSHENGRITLRDVNPLTISFSDRPDRIAGHMPTSKFVPMWSQGADSFLSNPPNATLSVFRGDAVSSTVVVLRNPRLVGEDLSYEVKVLEGTLPAQSGPCSLFIDIIGMPLTPFSYAGAARRAWRRGELTMRPPPIIVLLSVITARQWSTTAIQSCARASSGKRRPPANVQLGLDPAPAFAGVESVDHAYPSFGRLLRDAVDY